MEFEFFRLGLSTNSKSPLISVSSLSKRKVKYRRIQVMHFEKLANYLETERFEVFEKHLIPLFLCGKYQNIKVFSNLKARPRIISLFRITLVFRNHSKGISNGQFSNRILNSIALDGNLPTPIRRHNTNGKLWRRGSGWKSVYATLISRLVNKVYEYNATVSLKLSQNLDDFLSLKTKPFEE